MLCNDKGEVIEQLNICRHSPAKHYAKDECGCHEKHIKK